MSDATNLKIEYVRKDIHDALQARVQELERFLQELDAGMRREYDNLNDRYMMWPVGTVDAGALQTYAHIFQSIANLKISTGRAALKEGEK